ncbi:MAG: hypothetical protein AB1722_08235 [Pseudomonadota bacterium]
MAPRTLIAVLGLTLLGQAWAAPDEIQVYTEELNQPGEFGLEQHLNYSLDGQRSADYPGQMPPHHVLQATPEFSYGLSDTLEAGLYVPFAFTPGGDAFLNGLRLRLKYIAPRMAGQRSFYGLNVEVGRDTNRTSDSLTGMELRPIVGYRDARWLVSFNPILNLGLADGVSHRPLFEPALKLTHRVNEAMRGGMEYYGEYGPLNGMLPGAQRVHTLYAVLDVETAALDLNLGLGRGNANATDKWVAKAIIALPLE